MVFNFVSIWKPKSRNCCCCAIEAPWMHLPLGICYGAESI